ncbi:MAG TPA: YciI family protein [Vicinamibacterales bacterium]|nr:YciI family protein [Vicinamibacterales bacterium]
MFIIELTYTAPLDRIDAHMKAHMQHSRKHYAAGRFLVSGRKIPRDGGVILATGGTREEVEAIARQDPFVTAGLADVRVVEFRASQKAADVQQRIEAEPSR